MNDTEQAADLAAVDNFKIGQIFRHIIIRDRYSTAEVLEVNRETGCVRLRLMKRSCSNRWNIDIGAAKLLKYLPMAVGIVQLLEEVA